jgi:hypothetical protein
MNKRPAGEEEVRARTDLSKGRCTEEGAKRHKGISDSLEAYF